MPAGRRRVAGTWRAGIALVAAALSVPAAAHSGATAPATSPASASAVPAALPGAPTAVRALPGDRSLTVSWSAPASGGTPVAYRVQLAVTGGTWESAARTSEPTRTVQLTGLVNGRSYLVRVAALSRDGWGPWSARTAVTLPSVALLDGGSRTTCAVVPDSTLRCWGDNQFGQLGDGTVTDSTRPLTVVQQDGTPLAGVTSVGVGGSHVCAALVDGTARCWGHDDDGQLGAGTMQNARGPSTPVVTRDGTLRGVVQVVGGGHHSCALLGDGTVWCWGRNTFGQLGDGTLYDRSVAAIVRSATGVPLGGAVHITAGDHHTCALLAGGTVRCWGLGLLGQLGTGRDTNRTTPAVVRTVLGPLGGVTDVDAEGYHTCAATTAGSVFCWGHNDRGQLGDGTTDDQPLARRVPLDASVPSGRLLGVTTGVTHTCATTARRTVLCWGDGVLGQLGDGSATGSLVPVGVGGQQPLTRVRTVSAGRAHTCAVLLDGTPRCWGLNLDHQLGRDTSGSLFWPLPVRPVRL